MNFDENIKMTEKSLKTHKLISGPNPHCETLLLNQ